MYKYIEITQKTADEWISKGIIWETGRGEENTYFTNEFEMTFYTKRNWS